MAASAVAGRALKRKGVVSFDKQRYGVGLSWDAPGHVKSSVDLDLQCVAVDSAGSVVDAVYYNRLEGADRALMHTGDERSGAAQGMDEAVWMNLSKLKRDICLLIFVVASHNGRPLKEADGAKLTIVEKWQNNKVTEFQLEKSLGTVMPVLCCSRAARRQKKEGQEEEEDLWTAERLDCVAEPGCNFMDILEPTIGGIVRGKLKSAPANIQTKLKLPMDKGTKADLPSLDKIFVGVGWDMGNKDKASGKGGAEPVEIDLDVSAVLFAEGARSMGAVYYNNTRQFGISHTGDNTTGAGEGDDEVIKVEMLRIPEIVQQIHFIINIYTKDVSFESLQNAYCRVFDAQGYELARYELGNWRDGELSASGLVLARLVRSEKTKKWYFQAIGAFCPGRRWMDRRCIEEMEMLFRKSPKEIQQLRFGGKTGAAKKQDSVKVEKMTSELKVTQVKSTVSDRLDAARFGTTSSLLFKSQKSTVEVDSVPQFLVGIGWDVDGNVLADMDVSAVFFHEEGRDMGAVDFENPAEMGVRHSGDNRTGEGDGDDEVVSVDLLAIPKEVVQIFFTVNVYTKGLYFSNVLNAQCRIVNPGNNEELVKYELKDMRETEEATGLIIAQLFRHPQRGWCFKSQRVFCPGRTWLDPVMMSEMKALFSKTEEELAPPPEAKSPPMSPRMGLWRKQSYSTALGQQRQRVERLSSKEGKLSSGAGSKSKFNSGESGTVFEAGLRTLLPRRVVVSL